MKYILILIIFIISCTPYYYDRPKYNIEIDNIFTDVLVENIYYNITLENISNQIIIEINYNINGIDKVIIDDIVPKQKVVLLSRYDKDIICIITGVIFYY